MNHTAIDTEFSAEISVIEPKILIVDLSRKFGGASSRVLTLIQNLPAGFAALAVLKDSPIAQEAQRLQLPIVVVGQHKASPLILVHLVSAIRKDGFRVIDTQNPQSKFWGSLAALLTGTSLVSTLNSWYIDEHGKGSVKGFFYALLELATNFSLDRYVVVSQPIFDALVRFGVDRSKIQLIYNAVDTNSDNGLKSKLSLVEKFNLPSDSLLVVTAGRFVWAKGFDDLVNAFHILAKKIPNVYCLIAGDGKLYKDVKSKIEAVGLQERVILLGHISREDVLSLINASDIFVMSSRTEGTPMVLLEAASLNKPILATNVGGIPELFKNEEECLLVSPGDPKALASNMERLLVDRKLSDRLANAANIKVKRDFSISSQVRETMSVYNLALSN